MTYLETFKIEQFSEMCSLQYSLIVLFCYKRELLADFEMMCCSERNMSITYSVSWIQDIQPER